jgi:porphobilinogen synthase
MSETLTSDSAFGYGLRRLRQSPVLRDMVAGPAVTADNLMLPLFVCEGTGVRREVASMPGVYQLSIDMMLKELEPLIRDGLRAVMLFGVIAADAKDDVGSHALTHHSIVARAIRAIRAARLPVLVAADLCFCEYTSHGHCGVPDPLTTVNNEVTVRNLGVQAAALADSGADLIAPSGMMDHAVAGIRRALDEGGFGHLPIMAYAVKYSSAFYGPFRDAAQSAPAYGDRKQYQQDPRGTLNEAIREAEADVAEGADVVMVKPGLPYLDVLGALAARLTVPLAVYNVSGEYAMLKAAAAQGWINHDGVLAETLFAFRRAGASIIISYSVPDALRLMRGRGRL